MGKIIDKTITKIVTEEGISLFRRVTKVLMPNGKYRYPVDYFDATRNYSAPPMGMSNRLTVVLQQELH